MADVDILRLCESVLLVLWPLVPSVVVDERMELGTKAETKRVEVILVLPRIAVAAREACLILKCMAYYTISL